MCVIIIHLQMHTHPPSADKRVYEMLRLLPLSSVMIVCVCSHLIPATFSIFCEYFPISVLHDHETVVVMKNSSCSIGSSRTFPRDSFFPFKFSFLLFIESWTPVSSQFYELLYTQHIQQPFDNSQYININHHAVSV